MTLVLDGKNEATKFANMDSGEFLIRRRKFHNTPAVNRLESERTMRKSISPSEFQSVKQTD
jgi:hypothetical protein